LKLYRLRTTLRCKAGQARQAGCYRDGEAKLASGLQNAAATKDPEIQWLKAKLDATELAQKLVITEAVNGVARERDELKNGLAPHCETGFKETRAAHALR
jgi:hypothetical protein